MGEVITYLPTCLLRKALSLAVQGLMMLSEGETKVVFLKTVSSVSVGFLLTGSWMGDGGNVLAALLHLGLEDLTMVLHAHDIGLGICVGLGLRGHRDVDVSCGEDVGRHCCCVGIEPFAESEKGVLVG
jgi:hypothetical protein